MVKKTEPQQQQIEPYKAQQNQIPHPKEALKMKCFALDFGTLMWKSKECQWIIINCKSDKRKAAVSIVLRMLADNKIRVTFLFWKKKKKKDHFSSHMRICRIFVTGKGTWVLFYPYGPIVTDAQNGLGKVWLILSTGFFLAFFPLICQNIAQKNVHL